MGFWDTVRGRSAPDPQLRGTFAPRADGPVSFRELMSTFRYKDRFGSAGERARTIASETRDAASLLGPIRTGRGAAGASTAEELGFAATGVREAVSGASGTPVNPIYQGFLSQAMARQSGFVIPMQPNEGFAVADVPVEAVAASTELAPPAASEATSDAVAAVDEASAKLAALEQQMLESFERLAGLDDAARAKVLTAAVDARAAAGAGPTSVELLTRSLADGPLEDSIRAMRSALDAHVAEAAEAAADVASPVVERAAPVADDVAELVARAVPEVVAKAVPEVVAKAVPEVVEHVAPVVARDLAPIAGDAAHAVSSLASHGAGSRLMGMSAGIAEALRLLR